MFALASNVTHKYTCLPKQVSATRVTCMMFICLICCLLIVSVDPDIGNKTTCLFDHENFLEK